MIVRFNRHQTFNSVMMEYHSETLRLVEFHHLNKCENWFNDMYNMLCGIWDGYLYTEMIPMAKELGYPQSIIDRIDFTEAFINHFGKTK
jgi:hypothetical protein